MSRKIKIKIISTLFILLYFCIAPLFSSFTNAENYYYAKIMDDSVYLYSQPIDDSGYYLFSIPESYFVLLLDEENDDFYYAKYDDVYGYVKKSEVVAMNGTPSSPFASSQFRIFALEGMGMYSSPYFLDENNLTNIPYLTDDLVYYGEIEGQAIPDKSNIWYYCDYRGEKGYVYSVFCDSLEINLNNEYFDVIESPFFEDTTAPLSSVAMTFIIIGVSLPCIVVIYLLIKPTFSKDKVLNNKPKFPKKKRHGDYYEFVESDLN